MVLQSLPRDQKEMLSAAYVEGVDSISGSEWMTMGILRGHLTPQKNTTVSPPGNRNKALLFKGIINLTSSMIADE